MAGWYKLKKKCQPAHNKNNQKMCVQRILRSDWHPPSLIRVFAVRMKKAWVLSYPLSAQLRLIRLEDAQADLDLRLAHMPFCWFCHAVARMLTVGAKLISIYYKQAISAVLFQRQMSRQVTNVLSDMSTQPISLRILAV